MTALIALETCRHPRYAERRRLCESSWGLRMPEGYEFRSFDGPRLFVPDHYNGLVQKTNAIARVALRDNFDWLVIVDDDVYVRTECLRPPEADYAGHVLPRDPAEPERYCAGAFYWLSRRAIRIIAEASTETQRPWAEDMWVGEKLREKGILPVEMPEIALEPCTCGHCIPEIPGEEWTAYAFWMKWDAWKFREFNSASLRASLQQLSCHAWPQSCPLPSLG